MPDCSPIERMICVAARFLEEGASVTVGTGAPCAAAMLAQRLHSPNLVITFEAGGLAPRLPTMAISVGDSRIFYQAAMASSMYDIMESCQRGMMDYAFLLRAHGLRHLRTGAHHPRPSVRSSTCTRRSKTTLAW